MSKIKEYIKLLQSNNVPFEKQQEALQAIEQAIKDAKAKKEEVIGQKADLVVSAFKQIEDKLNKKFDELLQTPAMKGEPGPKGKDGRDGKDGKDGLNGRDGRDGVDGKDGVDGVSVVDARIDFDGSLVITLSDGSEIDAGEVVSSAIAKEVNNFMTRGEILPLQTGNSGKYLKTDGNTLSWDTLDGSDINLSSPPAIGNTTPNTGSFTQVRVNQSWDEGTGRLQINGQAAIEGNAVAQDVIVQGGNNLLLRSQEFQTTWTTSNASISADATTAPDGTLTADKLNENSATGTHAVLQSVNLSAISYTYSVFLKAAERGYALVSNTTLHAISVDLSTGVATSALGSPTNITSTPLGNNWWRVGFTFTGVAGSSSMNVYSSIDGVWANRSFAGTTNSGIFVWGAQLELGTVASPYTPTTSAAVTTTNDITVPSGQVQTALGSASAPSYSILGDTNTGLFSPAADNISVTTAGREAIRVDSSGRTAFNIPSLSGAQTGMVDVIGGFDSLPLRVLRHAAYGEVIRIGRNGVSETASINYPTDGAFAINTNGSERMRINSSGNVGVGTSSPLTRLHVMVSDVTGYTSVQNDGIVIERTGGTAALNIATDNNRTGAIWFADGDAAAQGQIVYDHSTDALYFGTNASERLRINSSGNVGIGITPNTWGAGSKIIQLGATTSLWDTGANSFITNNNYNDGSNKYITTGYAGRYGISSSTGAHTWQVAASGTAGAAITFTEAMRITDAGLVGIGTNAPEARLHVAGGNILLNNNQSIRFKNSAGTDESVLGISTANNLALNSPTASGSIQITVRSASNSCQFFVGSTEYLRLTSSGLFVGNGDTSATPANGTVSGTNGSGTNITGATLTIQGGRGTGTGAGGPIVFSTSAAGTTGTTLNAATERMRVTDTGRVGIGTSSPASLLHVSDGTLTVSGANATIALGYNSGSTGSIVNFSSSGKLQFVGGGTNRGGEIEAVGGSASSNAGVILFRTGTGSGTQPEQMRITAAGDVGIGTASPGAKLDVSGTAQASQLRAATAYTVATLPTASAGMIARVTDGDAGLAWGATVVNSGAGATPYLVWYNGTNWTVMGK